MSSHSQTYQDVTDPGEIKSLLSSSNDLQGFGGVDVKITDMVDERSALVGGYGGVLINRSYMLGLGAYGIVNGPSFEGLAPGIEDSTQLSLYGGYGGLLLGGTLFAKEMLHISLPLFLGAGNLEVSDDDFFQGIGDTSFTVESSVFFVVEPSLQLEFNITSYLRIAGGASYRWVRGLELTNVTDDQVTGFSGILSVRLGRF
ncbi:MAG: hypothetical protein AAGA85_04245 [Bacteroidota bacterium]